jgi:hypothetical protein
VRVACVSLDAFSGSNPDLLGIVSAVMFHIFRFGYERLDSRPGALSACIVCGPASIQT